MKRITGTHLYTFLKCPRAVALDMHGDRDQRRPFTEAEEFSLQRGRDLESRIVADLEFVEPEYPQRDFDAGAAATLKLMREGVPGIAQGVLLGEQRLGIPDLLRREEGPSDFGEYHYVVGDIKSSARPRGDQILQIMFYTQLLAKVQGREPDHAYLILKDGHEESFRPSDFSDAAQEVEQRVLTIATADAADERSFLSAACSSCRWSDFCMAELVAEDDLSLVSGMMRGLRMTLEAAGVTSVSSLCESATDSLAKRTRIEPALLRQLRKAAQAQAAGEPLSLPRSRHQPIESCAAVHLLRDAFADRVLWMGVLWPCEPDGEVFEAWPERAEDEGPAFEDLLARVPREAPLLHYGSTLPWWHEEMSHQQGVGVEIEARMVDLKRRLRGAAIYQGPVFSMDDHVRFWLNLDPHREGDANAGAMWAEQPEGRAWLSKKGRSDLMDLALLKERATADE